MEIRHVRFRPRVRRSRETGAPIIEGYAAVFRTWSLDLGGFRERLLPGAFKRTLLENPDVYALHNHETAMVLGRTPNTLKLWEDARGLRVQIFPPDSEWGHHVVASIKRGDTRGMSFGFAGPSDSWELDSRGDGLRTIIDIGNLIEVSTTAFPAYPSTSVAVRRDGTIENLQLRLRLARMRG